MFSLQAQAVLHLIRYRSTLIRGRRVIRESVTLRLSTIIGIKLHVPCVE